MHWQQLHIFGMIIGALTYQSMAASFYCSTGIETASCDIGLGNNQDFHYSYSSWPGATNNPSCSPDGTYCVTGMCFDCFENWWEIFVTKNGEACTAYCGSFDQQCLGPGCWCNADGC